MKHKRLDRDSWLHYRMGCNPEYYQFRADITFDGSGPLNEFHGLICLLPINWGIYYYWDFPIAGKLPVVGKGMKWLQLIPDNEKHVTTVKYYPKKRILDGIKYDYSAMVWYIDMIEDIEYDSDGVAVFVDKYLDLIFDAQGDIKVDDRDELDEALESGDITPFQHQAALDECDMVRSRLCSSIPDTEIYCAKILDYALNRVRHGESVFKTKFWSE